MINNWLFGKSDLLVEKSLDGLALRMHAAASNVANLNTPGYVHRSVSFEAALREAYEQSPDFLPQLDQGEAPSALQTFEPTTQRDALPQRLDGNTTVIESEMADLGRTAIAYQAMARQAGYSELKTIIQNGSGH